MPHAMTLAEFGKMRQRDFENAAISGELYQAVRQREELLAACEAAYEELLGYADAGGSNKAAHLCDQLREVIANAKS